MSEYTLVPNKCVSYSAAYRSFKSMLKIVGLDPSKFGLHSPRIGATTDAFFNNVPNHVIDQQGRWKCPLSKFTYLRFQEKEFVSAIKHSSRY
jgi:hypothetical protein